MSQAVLIERLQSIRSCAKALGFVAGGALSVAFGMGLFLALLGLDYLVRLPSWPRVAFMGIALILLVMVLYRRVIKVAFAKLSLGDVAGRVERVFPEFDDRLRSMVDFINPNVPGSAAMKDRTVQEAADMAAHLDLGRALATRPVWGAGGAAAVMVGAVAALAMLGGQFWYVGHNRLLHPFGQFEYPRNVEIGEVDGIPQVAAVGQRLEIKLALNRGFDAGKPPTLFIQVDDGVVEKQVMTVTGTGTFSAPLDVKGHRMAVWVEAGDDNKTFPAITVVPRLEATRIEADVMPPAYASATTGPTTQTVDLSQESAQAVVGAPVDVRVWFNKPVGEGSIQLETVRTSAAIEETAVRTLLTSSVVEAISKEEVGLAALAWHKEEASGTGEVWVGRFVAQRSIRFHVKAADIYGFYNDPAYECEIDVHPDALPAVNIENPRKSDERTAVAVIPLLVKADDDFGISEMTLVVDKLANGTTGTSKHFEVPLTGWTGVDSSDQRQRYSLNYAWDLASFAKAVGQEFVAGDVLEYSVRVRDNFAIQAPDAMGLTRTVTHPAVSSLKLRATIISQETLTQEATYMMQRQATALVGLKETQDRNVAETHDIRTNLEQLGHVDSSERLALARLADQQGAVESGTSDVASQLKDLQNRLVENRSDDTDLAKTAQEVNEKLKAVADSAMADAARELGNAQPPVADDGSTTKSSDDGAGPASAPAPGDANSGSPSTGPSASGTGDAGTQPAGVDAKGQPGDKSSGQNASGSHDKGSQSSGQSQGASGSPQTPEQQKAAAEAAKKDLQNSENSQQVASAEMKDALDRMGNFGALENLRKDLESALAKQQALTKDLGDFAKQHVGEDPSNLSKEDQDKLAKLAADQAKAGDDTRALAGKLNDAAKQQEQSNKAASDAMKQAAQQESQQNVAGNQAEAAAAAGKNQQATASARQQEAELGLKMMLSTLQEAERHQLEELVRKIEELQAKIALLVKRQAGHNVDNLVFQGRANEVSGDLIDTAQRDPATTGPAAATQQAVAGIMDSLRRGQAQTMTNTRSYASDAEKLDQGGAEIAAGLSKAADQMERAEGLIVDEKLADAYQPPQVNALDDLKQAYGKLEAIKQEANKKIDEQNQDAIRKQFEEIRADQAKLNVETNRLDGAPKGDDGGLAKREDALSLGELPDDQGALGDKVKKLSTQLATFKSVVFTWASDDVAKSMGEVKDDLTKPDTGAVTQAEQQRILDQLDAMIRDLQIRVPPKRFEQEKSAGGSGSGGGGQSKSPMPSEAELRLLKDLQLGLNNSTKAVAKANDPATLKTLGERQNQLRDVLRGLFQNVTQQALGDKPPDPGDELPPDATAEQITQKESEAEGLTGDPTIDDALKLARQTAERQGHSYNRLEIKADPGGGTQEYQRRILDGMDKLADLAKQQEQNSQQQQNQGQSQGEQQQAKRPDEQPEGGPQSKSTPADQTVKAPAGSSVVRTGNGTGTSGDLNADRNQALNLLTARARDAVLQGADENVIERYHNLTDAYYRSLATQSGSKQ